MKGHDSPGTDSAIDAATISCTFRERGSNISKPKGFAIKSIYSNFLIFFLDKIFTMASFQRERIGRDMIKVSGRIALTSEFMLISRLCGCCVGHFLEYRQFQDEFFLK